MLQSMMLVAAAVAAIAKMKTRVWVMHPTEFAMPTLKMAAVFHYLKFY
jgi:hypothetical protein